MICFEVYLGRKINNRRDVALCRAKQSSELFRERGSAPEQNISFAIINNRRDVAQSGSAPCSGRGGRKFKSCHPDIFQSINTRLLYLYPLA